MGRRYTDSKQYDLPTSDDISDLIVGDIGEYESGRGIIIEIEQKLHKELVNYTILTCLYNIL